MRLAIVGLASSHVDQIVRLSAAARLGPARIGALIDTPAEPVAPERIVHLRQAGTGSSADVVATTDTARPPAAARPTAAARRTAAAWAPRAAGTPGNARTAEIAGTTEPSGIAEAVLAAGCQAAIVATRDPAHHRALAEPLLRAGIPVFVDKPFVAELRDAEALVAAAARAGVLLTSSSALRWHPTVLDVAQRWSAGPNAVQIRVTGPADPASPWGGRLFLGVHAVEAALGALPGPVADTVDRPRVVSVTTRGNRRVAEIAVGSARAVVELGGGDGWHLSGPDVDADLELDPDYLRPPLLGFIDAVTRGDHSRVIAGAALIDAARVLTAVCA